MDGPIAGFDPVISHLLRGSEHIRGDVGKWLGRVPDEVLWSGSAGFHAKHLAGSTERLTTYLQGRPLSREQLTAIPLEHEQVPGVTALIHAAFDVYDATVRELKPEDFGTLRYIGRQRLPVTAVSLAIHIIEHGQRHLGQAIEALKCSK